jgi:hypothetical protein
MMAIFPSHLAATPRLGNLLPPPPLPVFAARWFPQSGRFPEKRDRSAASVRYVQGLSDPLNPLLVTKGVQ